MRGSFLYPFACEVISRNKLRKEIAMPESFNEFGAMLAAFLPNLLAAILVLVVGWLVAFLLSKAVEALLRRTSLDDRLAGMLQGGQPNRLPIERWIALGVFWLIMLFVIVIFLQTLNLGDVSDPLNSLLGQVVAFLPFIISRSFSSRYSVCGCPVVMESVSAWSALPIYGLYDLRRIT